MTLSQVKYFFKYAYNHTYTIKDLIWLTLQFIRIDIFWTKDMKLKNRGKFAHYIGKKILDMQNSNFFKKK